MSLIFLSIFPFGFFLELLFLLSNLLLPKFSFLLKGAFVSLKFFEKVDVGYPRLKSKIESFLDLSSLEKEIHRVITNSLTVSDHASDELFQIRTKLKKIEASLQSKIASLNTDQRH